jgi:hypothetical protein
MTLSEREKIRLLRLGGRAASALGSAGLEAVLESARDVLEVAAAAGADSLSSLGLLTPVVCVRVRVSIASSPLWLRHGTCATWKE